MMDRSMLAFFFFLLSSCSGPSSPFGSIEKLTPPMPLRVTEEQAAKGEVTKDSNSAATQEEDIANLPKIDMLLHEPHFQFYPPRQVLHRESHLKVVIDSESPLTDNYQLAFFYNGDDHSDTVLDHARITISEDRLRITVDIENLKLPSRLNHDIMVFLKPSPQNPSIGASYQEPECPIHKNLTITDTEDFNTTPDIIKLIVNESRRHHMNPALIAGLIAKESSFNPTAVSWAKAVGLTQMTELADKEIADQFKAWPRNPLISEYSAPIVKSMIITGQINSKNEWRLDPRRSIIGGIAFLQYLIEYWNKSEFKSHIESSRELNGIILGSYNAGAARVKNAYQKLGKKWNQEGNLSGLLSYRNTINSLCYHFSHQERSPLMDPF